MYMYILYIYIYIYIHVIHVYQGSSYLFRNDLQKLSEYFQQLGCMGAVSSPIGRFGPKCYPNARKLCTD